MLSQYDIAHHTRTNKRVTTTGDEVLPSKRARRACKPPTQDEFNGRLLDLVVDKTLPFETVQGDSFAKLFQGESLQ